MVIFKNDFTVPYPHDTAVILYLNFYTKEFLVKRIAFFRFCKGYAIFALQSIFAQMLCFELSFFHKRLDGCVH